MDFYKIKEKVKSNGVIEIYPDFKVCRSSDLMVRGKAFYAIWDEEQGLWSTDEYDVQRLVDKDLLSYKDEISKEKPGIYKVLLLSDFSTNSWMNFKKYINNLSDSNQTLDNKIFFEDSKISKKDYASKRLPYSLSNQNIEAYEELISKLYDEENRQKIEWAIGSIFSGDSKNIQKFMVLYGDHGTGKSTVINIIQKLFKGYYATFDAKALTTNNNSFSTDVFRSNPLVAVQHDGDLSKIEDNTKLNSIVSHEEMTMNEKYKSSYTSKCNCFLFLATNKPVKITDAKSGIIRRLVDVKPTGFKFPKKKYDQLYSQIDYELGGIAMHCINVYKELGSGYYNNYVPFDMIFQTDVFFNFVEDYFDVFKEQDGCSLKQAYSMYKEYCEDSLIPFKLPMYKFREELKNYFDDYKERARIDDRQVRCYFSGFKAYKFVIQKQEDKVEDNIFELKVQESLFDKLAKDYPAQLASEDGFPTKKWENNKNTLKDIDTSKLHYVKVPDNHIVIDFDLKDENGNKSLTKNIAAASKYPPTYAEVSKSGKGIHLHYIYTGDVSSLSNIISEGIEIKKPIGNSSIRRKLTLCNNLEVSTISSGLPQRSKKMINFESVKDEKHLRALINKALKKEIHANTKPNIDYIKKVLDDAYNSGMPYDVRDLRTKILSFANNSTNQSGYCVNLVSKMQFNSEEQSENKESSEEDITFFDIEVYPNLFLIGFKTMDVDNFSYLINPKPSEIEKLFDKKLVGFNCRRYDNHMVYAAYLGYTTEQLFKLSQKIISGSKNAFFGEAYNISYTDVYDFCSKKQSLKKWEIELGIHHQELEYPWNKPVPEKNWPKVIEYNKYDVLATEAVFKARKADFVAREILAELSGGSINDTTNSLTAKLIFGNDKNPQSQFNYRDLSDMSDFALRVNNDYTLFDSKKRPIFDGYKFENGESTYMGEKVGEGGRVLSVPGIYYNVALLDIESMHPSTIVAEQLFGKYTDNFNRILQIRLAIKHKNIKKAKTLGKGMLDKYLEDDELVKALAYALKIAINSVYGLTAASFNNLFRDPRNIDNIVAKRGALFMINLTRYVREHGYEVAHIKTDSIKIPNADQKIIDLVKDYGQMYGYNFDHEATYEKMCLVNDAVYIAKYKDDGWTATGTQFAVPYVFKTLFSHDKIEFTDLCETKAVTSTLYLDMNENLEEGEHDLKFIGKVGSFCPIKPGCGGGILLRENGDKYSAAVGSKGYRWLEAEVVKELGKEDDIDLSYYRKLADDAIDAISKYGDFDSFISDDTPPWN